MRIWLFVFLIPIIGICGSNDKNTNINLNEEEYDVRKTLNTNEYDTEVVFKEGLYAIDIISQGIDEFAYWKDSEVINYEFLRSFYTGKALYALFDILGSNGQYGYIIINCKTHESDCFAASKSPYKLFDENKNNLVTADAENDIFLFYAAVSYGYGVIDENDRLDIYDIRSIYGVYEPKMASDVRFQSEEPVKIKGQRTLK